MTFAPIFQERVWGGRRLESAYYKSLPPGVPVGESWEIVDRPEAVSVIANGELAGQNLHWVMEHQRRELLGQCPAGDRFPLLIKILDAQDALSLQVHPPAAVAGSLGGEPKTEMWFVTDATPEGEVYFGLKKGVTRDEFVSKLASGTAAECLHRQRVRAGDALFLPSGRVHALGAGVMLFEVQQNSDTTYRVFDWNRLGQDGKPRPLHIDQALASIDFNDFEPEIVPGHPGGGSPLDIRSVVKDPLFSVDAWNVRAGETYRFACPQPLIFGVVSGYVRVHGGEESPRVPPGGFCLVPASVGRVTVAIEQDAQFLTIKPG